VTAVSESLKQDTYTHFKTKKDISVIPNFICLDKYKPTKGCARSAFAKESEKIVMHVSNFRKVKRVEDVVRIFRRVRSSIDAKLVLVGDGPERMNVEHLCRELEVYNDTRFLGKVKDVEELLGFADVFLLPSESESFGLAALEAMAASVPVVSTNTGGLPEVNIQGKTGFLTNVGDVDGMAKFTLEILTNGDLCAEMRINARKRAEEFSLENILPMYMKVYEDVIKNK